MDEINWNDRLIGIKGSRGVGKTTCARILAKAVNCLAPIDGAPCCQCAACRAAGQSYDWTKESACHV